MTGHDSKTNIGQAPLECPFIELITNLVQPGTIVACIIPNTHLSALGSQDVEFRKFLLNDFGLSMIFNYPQTNLFDDVVQNTSIFIGQAHQTQEYVKFIQSHSFVSEIVQDTYRRFGIDFDKDFYNFSANDYPTFSDVYATIKSRIIAMPEHTHERETMEKLELKIRPLTNDLKYYFDGKTTITHNSDFITFNIKELMNAEQNIKNALFFNILKYAWGLCLDRNVDTIMMIDEAHVLLGDQNSLGADFLAQVQRRARK